MNDLELTQALTDTLYEANTALVTGRWGSLADALDTASDLLASRTHGTRWEVEVSGTVEGEIFHRKVVVEAPMRAAAILQARNDVYDAECFDPFDVELAASVVGRC